MNENEEWLQRGPINRRTFLKFTAFLGGGLLATLLAKRLGIEATRFPDMLGLVNDLWESDVQDPNKYIAVALPTLTNTIVRRRLPDGVREIRWQIWTDRGFMGIGLDNKGLSDAVYQDGMDVTWLDSFGCLSQLFKIAAGEPRVEKVEVFIQYSDKKLSPNEGLPGGMEVNFGSSYGEYVLDRLRLLEFYRDYDSQGNSVGLTKNFGDSTSVSLAGAPSNVEAGYYLSVEGGVNRDGSMRPVRGSFKSWDPNKVGVELGRESYKDLVKIFGETEEPIKWPSGS